MDHLVQFTISIDDNHIAQMVEKEAAKALMLEWSGYHTYDYFGPKKEMKDERTTD